jgi:hydrogenase maturation protease
MYLLCNTFPETSGNPELNEIKIIGVGSPFGADQAGWQLVDELQKKLKHTEPGHRFTFMKTDRPGVRLLSLLETNSCVVIIDAVDNKYKLGELLLLDKNDLLVEQSGLSTHRTGMAEIIQLGETLSILPEQMLIFGICIDVTSDTQLDYEIIRKLSEELGSILQQELRLPLH